jgi:hypothetical protein
VVDQRQPAPIGSFQLPAAAVSSLADYKMQVIMIIQVESPMKFLLGLTASQHRRSAAFLVDCSLSSRHHNELLYQKKLASMF